MHYTSCSIRWTALQTPSFQVWFDALDADAREDILAAVLVLERVGPGLGRPRVDTLKGSRYRNLKELRVQSNGRPFRILFVFDPVRNAVLLIGGDKSGRKRFYDTMIPLAEQIYREYLKDMADE